MKIKDGGMHNTLFETTINMFYTQNDIKKVLKYLGSAFPNRKTQHLLFHYHFPFKNLIRYNPRIRSVQNQANQQQLG